MPRLHPSLSLLDRSTNPNMTVPKKGINSTVTAFVHGNTPGSVIMAIHHNIIYPDLRVPRHVMFPTSLLYMPVSASTAIKYTLTTSKPWATNGLQRQTAMSS